MTRYLYAFLLLLTANAGSQVRIIRDTRTTGHPIRSAVFQLEQPSATIVTRALTIQLGDSSAAGFSPTLSFSAWDDCALTIHLPPASCPKEMLISTKTALWLTDQNKARHEYSLRPDSNFEWEIILDSAPSSNVLSYPIETHGLRFYYQPPLTPFEISESHERPDSVIGSYAVYRDGPSGSITHLGKRDTLRSMYGTGKAFHIYRPKAIDLSGSSIWCDLKIDSFLTITIPPAFLKSAHYPVRIDPTFGYTTAGASSLATSSTRCYGNKNALARHLAGANERIDSFKVNLKTYSGNNDSLDIALYSWNNGLQNRLDTAISIFTAGSNPLWVNSPPVNQPLVVGTEYTIAINHREGTPRVAYDIGISGDHSFENVNDLPPTWTEHGFGTYILSVYACYTITTSVSSPPPLRRRRTMR